MIRLVIIVILLFQCCVANESVSKDNKSIYRQLFEERLKEQYLKNEVDSLIKEIVSRNEPGNFDSIQKFLITNERYAYIGLYYLIMNNYNGFATWLNKNCNKITAETWLNLPGKFGARSPKPVSTETQIALFNCIYNIKDVDDRGYNINLLRKTCGYKCAQLAMSKLPTETDSYIRTRLYTMLSRFNTPEFNTIIKKLITDKIELGAVEYVSMFGFEECNRYDFLPELKKLEADLKKEKDPAKIGLQKSTLEQLATTIPVLEKKKIENAPIGLPLDWPGEGK